MADYKTLDSGARAEWSTGARRDTEEGKPRYDLISVHATKRIAELMARGAEKYGDRNWEKGIEISRFQSSGLRHFYQFLEGDDTEDHLAAVCFNVMAIMHTLNEIEKGTLPASLDDRKKNEPVEGAVVKIKYHPLGEESLEFIERAFRGKPLTDYELEPLKRKVTSYE